MIKFSVFGRIFFRVVLTGFLSQSVSTVTDLLKRAYGTETYLKRYVPTDVIIGVCLISVQALSQS